MPRLSGAKITGYVALCVAALGASLFLPIGESQYQSHPLPAQNFQEAEARIHALIAAESDSILPVCRTKFLSHQARTTRVFVFVHGYTSCPEQFATLGAQFYDDGSNVLIVPLPLHGLPDRLTDAHSQLTARQLVEYADEVLDIARGLGQTVTIAGLSAGGTVAGWAAQNRADVDMAVLISPVFGYAVVPPALAVPAARIYGTLPEKYEWWDTIQKEKLGPSYSYPRYSHHALAQLLRLACVVMAEAKHHGAAVREILVVTNPADDKISSESIRTMIDRWKRGGKTVVRTYEFPDSLHLGHDIIDPTLANQRTDIVYPTLMQLMKR
jgi:carboxylesterase